MSKKIIIMILGVAIIVLSLIFFPNSNSIDHKILEQTFEVKAIYFANDGYAEVLFHDKSNKTKHVVLEILGMPKSFHREYASSSFVEKIQLDSIPSYGWQSIPIILSVTHEELGDVGIKTEIRPLGEIPAKIIFSRE